MERLNCVVIEDDILEFLDEVEKQLGKGIICCKCQNPCEKTSRCAVAMKNLLTDIRMFKESYKEHNPEIETEQVVQVTQVTPTLITTLDAAGNVADQTIE